MTLPWKTWLIFAICCGVLLAAMGWISVTAFRLDHLQQHAVERADLEERVRLALWRMDSFLTPILAEESTRPASAYQAFSPAERAYTKSLTPVQQGDVLIPSPLLTYASSNVLLHFQLHPDGHLTSPQVPEESERALAESGYAGSERVLAAASRLGSLRSLLAQPDAPASGPAKSSWGHSASAPSKDAMNHRHRLFQLTAAATNPEVVPLTQMLVVGNNDFRQVEQQQQMRNTTEFNRRANFYQGVQQQAFFDNNGLLVQSPASAPENPGAVGTFLPVWLEDALVLARGVQTDAGPLVQGCWLNWPDLRASLLVSISDILPAAELRPSPGTNGTHGARALATLPVQLVPGNVPVENTLAWTPVRTSLAVAWICVLLAGLAVALLLHGALSLSERRAAFVSAVTHELRTPLTTFKLYSEMLADGMVSDEEKRRHYLATLCSEANRLSHLVENVLAYSRLERGSAKGRVERVDLGELIKRVKPRLVERAAHAGMELVDDGDERALRTTVHVDVSVVEQILFNLVDNACKYAAPKATDRTIHLEAVPENGKFALLRVRDHGQGISTEAAKRMFEPFNKSAAEAAHSAPGVGLGLALCRRLSRSMGGDLQWDRFASAGACFSLKLPLRSMDSPSQP